MKQCLFLMLATLLLSSACKKDSMSYKSEYDISYNRWKVYKNSIGNSYSYTAQAGSVLGNTVVETTITVTNGTVTARDYVQYQYAPNSSNATTVKQWHEDKAILNTHGAEANAPLTLDDVYNKAKSEWLSVDKEKNEIIFETSIDGLLKTCGYVSKSCADDCFTGVNIKSISSK